MGIVNFEQSLKTYIFFGQSANFVYYSMVLRKVEAKLEME